MRRHVYYYTHVVQPADRVRDLLATDPGRWLPLPATPEGDAWRTTLHADGALPEAIGTHDVLVQVESPTVHDGGLLRRVRWRSASAERYFPTLEGDLEVSTLDGFGVQVSMLGAYQPPLSGIGEAGDRLLGRRVAEACVRRFLLDIEARLAGLTHTA